MPPPVAAIPGMLGRLHRDRRESAANHANAAFCVRPAFRRRPATVHAGVMGCGAPVKQVSVEPRGRDIYAEIIVEQDVDRSEAEGVLDHAPETMEHSLSSEPEWYNYDIPVLRPDGSDVVSVAVDAPQMFEDRW